MELGRRILLANNVYAVAMEAGVATELVEAALCMDTLADA